MNMSQGIFFIKENIRFLRQGILLLERLDEKIYCASVPPFFMVGIGKHFRHIMDHYSCLLGGLQGTVNYNQRQRELILEQNPEQGRKKLNELITRLEEIAELPGIFQRDLKIICEDHPGSEGDPPSNLTRELQYLVSHTVHHYALIAMMLKIQGVMVDPEFGVASSTLRYLRNESLKTELSTVL